MRVLLLLSPGYFRDSLVSLLHTLPQVEVSCIDWQACCADLNEPQPDLIVVKAGYEVPSLMKLKELWPEARVLALVEKVQNQASREFSGYDRILQKSSSVGEFLSLVNEYSRSSETVLEASRQPTTLGSW